MSEKEQGGTLLPRAFSYFLKRMGKSHPFVLPADLINSSELLLIDSGDVTDLLFSSRMVNYFHEHYPKISMTLLVHEPDAEIAKSVMRVKRMITYEQKQMHIYNADYMSLIKNLKKRMVDSAILLGKGFSLERYLIAFASGAGIRIGFENPLAFPFLNCEIRLTEETYEGNKMSKVLGSIGLRPEESSNSIHLSERERKHAKQLIHFRKPEKDYLTVGIDPGRGKTRHHVIPDIIAYLANNLAGRRKVKFLVLASLGRKDDREPRRLFEERGHRSQTVETQRDDIPPLSMRPLPVGQHEPVSFRGRARRADDRALHQV